MFMVWRTGPNVWLLLCADLILSKKYKPPKYHWQWRHLPVLLALKTFLPKNESSQALTVIRKTSRFSGVWNVIFLPCWFWHCEKFFTFLMSLIISKPDPLTFHFICLKNLTVQNVSIKINVAGLHWWRLLWGKGNDAVHSILTYLCHG